ncbi:platelet-activating factor acetylhydrolase IB subunit alpha2-like [Adelges cooleyi]|uniref:platelet-activating factor acetylhydrolase IB subunit alpha2-like n=1 Tax=Adelges cooleyi TaxID=133065 RepID=UPI00217F8790|nr:platelet-activating factor acetylhydrolase IB subunit alpha2-like [Adelges cooleyi]
MNSCTIPAVPEDLQGDNRWMSQHERHVSEAKEREPDVILIGDSIIQQLQLRPIWNDLFEPLHCLNFGIGGDLTQGVLWRIQNGILDNIKPKACVIHVGTNNFGNTPEEISEGILMIVNEIKTRLPDCYIVLLDLLPRGAKPNQLRVRNSKVNEIVHEKVKPISRLEVITVNTGLLQSDDTLSAQDMLDYLHPTESCYRKIFEPVHEVLLHILGEAKDVDKEIIGTH